MEACVGSHHLSRKLQALGHDARLMPAKYVRPYSKGEKNDYRDAEAIAEAVQRPTMKFVATKSSTTDAPSSASRPMRPGLLDPRAVRRPVKAWPANTGASDEVIATASLDRPLARGAPVHPQAGTKERPPGTNKGTVRSKEIVDDVTQPDLPAEVCERMRRRWRIGLPGACEHW
jgi:hypothetical protein